MAVRNVQHFLELFFNPYVKGVHIELHIVRASQVALMTCDGSGRWNALLKCAVIAILDRF
jgi:hypothetical protein